MAQQKAGALKPVAAWDINQIGSGSQSYCALSRLYDEGLVLTLGQNIEKEYSLAIDFQNADLDIGKSYKVALQPGPGQVRAYQLSPASQRAIVIRLGFDDSFFKALNQSKELKAQIDSKDYVFDLAEYAQGQATLDKCVSGLGGGSVPKAVPTPTPIKTVAKEVPKAEKIQPSEEVIAAPAPKIEKEVVAAIKEPMPLPKPSLTVAPSVVEKKTEAPVMAKPITEKISSRVVAEPTSAPKVVEVKLPTPEVKKAPPPPPMAEVKPEPTPVAEVKAAPEPIQKKMAMEDAPKPFVEPVKKAKTVSNFKVSKYQDLETETPVKPQGITSLGGGVSKPVVLKKRENDSVSVEPVKPSILSERPEIPKAIPKAEVVATKIVEMPEEKVSEKSEVVAQKLEPVKKEMVQNVAPVAEVATEAKTPVEVSRVIQKKPVVWNDTMEKKQQDEIERIKAENKRLNEALRAQISSPNARSSEEGEELVELKSQIKQLESELADREQQKPALSPDMAQELAKLKSENQRLMSSMKNQEDKIDSFDAASPTASKELDMMREELAALRSQNERLSKEAMKANNQIDGARMDAGNKALNKISEYEKRLEAATEDNLALSREIEQMRNRQDDKNIAVAAGDWDLEKSTRRYNEAEREIKRLGMLLEQQRTAHRAEKQELEQMLFDPAVTEKEQQRRLVELEAKLLAAESQLEALGRARPQDRYDGSLARLEAPSKQNIYSPVAAPMAPVMREEITPRRVAPQSVAQAPRPPLVQEKSAVIQQMMPPQRNPVPAPLVQDRRMAATQQPSFVTPVPQPVALPTPPQRNVALENLLAKAGVQSTSVRASADGEYQWRAGSVNGEAQVKSRKAYRSIGQFAEQYISNAKQACKGDFASSEAVAGSNVKSYDIVCLDGQKNVASSVVFAERGDEIMAITHMANTDDLDMAIDMRDRVADSL